MTPTPEQQAIIFAARGSSSLMINAYAGCAKTTTLELAAKELTFTGNLALAFNKRIKEELEKKLPPNFKVMTFNGLGHSALARALGKFPTIDSYKLIKLCQKRYPKDKELQQDLKQLVTLAMQTGFVPKKYPMPGLISKESCQVADFWDQLAIDNDISTNLCPGALAVLEESIDQAFKSNVISFDDQIYISSLICGTYEKYPVIFVDEAQDLSPLNHLQLRKSLSSSGRLIVVGDTCQAIYGFRGAHSHSMEQIRTLRSDWQDLPLTTTFRCPKVLVERQKCHAPGFNAAPSAPEGGLTSIDGLWTWRSLSPKPDAILCRNNAPLISLAFKLLRQNLACYMLGRDIGKGLKAAAKKLFPKKTLKADMEIIINSWKANNADTLKILDQAECLEAVMQDNCPDSKALQDKLDYLFSKESGLVVLSTGHKAKGLEWQTVLHLDPWRIPAKYAKGELELAQEANLRYVIETRAKEILILADLRNFS